MWVCKTLCCNIWGIVFGIFSFSTFNQLIWKGLFAFPDFEYQFCCRDDYSLGSPWHYYTDGKCSLKWFLSFQLWAPSRCALIFLQLFLGGKNVRTFVSGALVGSCLRTMTTLIAEQELFDSAVSPGTDPNERFWCRHLLIKYFLLNFDMEINQQVWLSPWQSLWQKAKQNNPPNPQF